MKFIYLDAGNTRLKFLSDQNGELSIGAVGYDELQKLGGVVSGADKIFVSMVGSCERKRIIRDSLSSAGGRIHYVSSEDMLSLVETDYRQPDLMGIDRWLAIYSILDDFKGCSVVVDAGTALTVDVLDGKKHIGGYIVPGYRAQLKILASTASLPAVVGEEVSVSLGLDTASCIERGAWMLLSSFVDSVVGGFPDSKLYLTGGDAVALAGLISSPVEVRNNLVLDGLIKFGLRVNN